MKTKFYVVLLIIFCLLGCSREQMAKEPEIEPEISFKPDINSLIRNPGMGWVLYDDANDEVADAEVYWSKQDEIARKYASCFYVRWRWSDFEPEEGKYAWEYDENYKALIKGALDRGLKLAFRVYVNGQDNIKPGTPQFVFDAGAESYEVSKLWGGKNLTPYPDDPIFQEKFENFIHAFAQEYDDADIVDFVDGFNLGWWGEGHHLKFKYDYNKNSTFSWIINLYGNAFNNVPLAITINSEIGYEQEKIIAFDGQGYVPRRDGFASKWFTTYERGLIKSMFPSNMIIAEAAYWGSGSISYYSKIDDKYDWNTWGEYYKQVVDEALEHHANYLDLREAVEAKRYLSEAKDQVERFVKEGGYRIFPSLFTYNLKADSIKQLNISHSWQNIGEGVFPNNNKRWNYKYKISFALFNSNDELVKQWIVKDAEPSDWIKGSTFRYNSGLEIADIEAGDYKLCCAIVDTSKNDIPAIQLAINNYIYPFINTWLIIDDLEIK